MATSTMFATLSTKNPPQINLPIDMSYCLFDKIVVPEVLFWGCEDIWGPTDCSIVEGVYLKFCKWALDWCRTNEPLDQWAIRTLTWRHILTVLTLGWYLWCVGVVVCCVIRFLWLLLKVPLVDSSYISICVICYILLVYCSVMCIPLIMMLINR